jgi:hypothetical protein
VNYQPRAKSIPRAEKQPYRRGLLFKPRSPFQAMQQSGNGSEVPFAAQRG